jgi:hypothetical protein
VLQRELLFFVGYHFFKGMVGLETGWERKIYTYKQSKERNNPPSDPYLMVQGS